MKKKLVILDFDGTLGDTRMNIVKTLQETMSQKGYPVSGEAECAATIGIPLYDAFRELLPEISEEEARECVDLYRDIFEVNKKILVPQMFPHVMETMQELHAQGVQMSVASSRSKASLQDFVEEMGINRYVDYVLGAEDVTHAKPHPEPVLNTLQHFGVEAADALVVGDMPYDILMGANAGVQTCGVTYGNATREQLEESKADYIIDDFGELAKILKQ